jgi:hypothetical protein
MRVRQHSVYDPAQRSYRVQYAKQCILRGMESSSRHYDTCFEMGDGTEVALALLKAALKSPRFREALMDSRVAPSIPYLLGIFPEFRETFASLGAVEASLASESSVRAARRVYAS